MIPIATTWPPVRWLAALALVVGTLAVAPVARHRHTHVDARGGSFTPTLIHRCHRGHIVIDRDHLIAGDHE
jgi:hypothetical protein